jgi:hypothetical protein
VGPRKTVAFEPRRYRALEALRVILYVFAGLVVAGWAIYSATAVFAATAIFSSGSDAPQWPADVPEGTSIFDPDLTEAQRSAIAQFETRQNEDSARGAIAAVGFITWLTATMSAFLIVVGFCSYAELIRVAIDVQQNTQFAAYQLAIRN